MKKVIGITLLVIGFALVIVQLVLPIVTGDSLPTLFGVPSGTVEALLNAVLMVVSAVSVYFGVYFLTDYVDSMIDVPPGAALVASLAVFAVLSFGFIDTTLHTRDEMRETSIEVREYVDPDTGVHYWVQEDVGMTPRLNPDGTIMVTPQD